MWARRPKLWMEEADSRLFFFGGRRVGLRVRCLPRQRERRLWEQRSRSTESPGNRISDRLEVSLKTDRLTMSWLGRGSSRLILDVVQVGWGKQ